METIVNNMDKFVIDENSAMKIYRSIRWGNGIVCPHCGSDNSYDRGPQDDNTRKYSCNSYKKNFNDFTALYSHIVKYLLENYSIFWSM
jgi:transposase-like protein